MYLYFMHELWNNGNLSTIKNVAKKKKMNGSINVNESQHSASLSRVIDTLPSFSLEVFCSFNNFRGGVLSEKRCSYFHEFLQQSPVCWDMRM